MDRISNLPDNVLEPILDKLSVVDQVTTSALSRNWRFKWTLVPSLKLDEEFFKCLSGSAAADFSNVIECVNIINSLLMQHRGRLRSFCLSMPESDQAIKPQLFDNPIRFVSRISGLENLTIRNDYILFDLYTLPSSVFCSVGLTHLILAYCELCPPPSFGGLPNLVSLCLEHCAFKANVITWILSSCPLLQELEMTDLEFMDQTLHISAPNLRYLYISGTLTNIYLEKAEDLEKVHADIFNLSDSLDGVVGTSASTFQVFPNPCSKLCEITISNYVCKLLASCGGLQKLRVFRRLKKLTFSYVDLHNLDVFRCVLSILTHSPNLETLTMTLGSIMDHVADISEYASVVEEYVAVGTNLGHLKEIFVKSFAGTSLQMTVIELLLGISPVLEQMHIKFNLIFSCPENELQILWKMLSFSRASGKAKIKRLW